MKFNLKLYHQGLIIVAVPLICELFFLGCLTYLLREANDDVQKQVRSKAIISQANELSKSFYDAGVAIGGYSITRSPLFSDKYDKSVHQIPQNLDDLATLVGNNPKQQEILKNLRIITVTGLRILGDARTAIDDNRVDVAQFRARHMYKQIRQLADKLQDELQGLTEDERKLESMSPDAQNRSRTMVRVFLFLGVLLNVAVAIGLSIFASRGIGRRLNVLSENSIRLSMGEELLEPMEGSDEISHLDNTFHQMAAALKEAHQRERAIVENAADVVCSIDMDGKFVHINRASETVWGYRQDELVGRRFIELVLPEDHADTIRAVRSVRAEKGHSQFENRTKRKDGAVVTILWSAYWSERERSMYCVAHDMTERKIAEEAVKASEKRIRKILESMPVGAIILTPEGYIESVNTACEKMYGYRQEELIGRHVLCLFNDSKLFSEHSPLDTQNFIDQLRTKSLNRIAELDALKKIGSDFPIEVSLTEMDIGDSQRLLANILDVSERREVERLKKEFVSTVSHELRTPLTSIRGSLTLLNVGALGALPEQAKKVVDIAERNTLRLITLINDILDIEKLESGKLDMVFETVSIANPLERASESVKAFAEQNGIKLEIIPSQSIVHADGDRIVQVLVNLVSNAVKFSPKGETVTVQVQDLPNWVEVKVIDRGRGIPASHKNLLFQRFQQVEASDAKRKGGTGLGLAICKGIIEAHGGTIGVDSEEGKGSTFWFRIPPVKQGALLKPTGATPAPAASQPASATQPVLPPKTTAAPSQPPSQPVSSPQTAPAMPSASSQPAGSQPPTFAPASVTSPGVAAPPTASVQPFGPQSTTGTPSNPTFATPSGGAPAPAASPSAPSAGSGFGPNTGSGWNVSSPQPAAGSTMKLNNSKEAIPAAPFKNAAPPQVAAEQNGQGSSDTQSFKSGNYVWGSEYKQSETAPPAQSPFQKLAKQVSQTPRDDEKDEGKRG